MNRVGTVSGGRRRQKPGRRAWVRMLWPVCVVFFLSGVALSMVWQNVQYTRASLRLEDARRRHAALLSDLNAQHMKVNREVTLSQLAPRAREKLGLIDSSTEVMRLVAFAPEVDQTVSPEPGLLDRIVPAAMAREESKTRHDPKEAARVDQENQ